MSAAPALLLDTEYIVVTLEHDGRIVRYRRTPVRFPDLATAQRIYSRVLTTYGQIGRAGRTLLIDSRDAVGRNDPEFEALLTQFRNQAIPGFVGHAVLMRTAVGLLQAQRIDRTLRSDRPAHLVTDNEEEATRFLLSQLPAAP